MIYLHLMGGLGNQMFQYAALRTLMLDNKMKGTLELSGIKGLKKNSHNVYSLDKLNISKEVKVIKNKKSIRKLFNIIIYIFYCVFCKNDSKYKFIKRIQPTINKIGCYCIPEQYLELSQMNRKNNYVLGYFQSYKYFKKYEKTIRDELQINVEISRKNKKIFKMIKDLESVCIHIRRGDYVGSNYDVCTKDYYLDAINKIKKKKKNVKLFFFSDDIDWVKENFYYEDAIYNEKNSSYEELKLMSNCKNFIISNSTFSWWAQFLSKNDDKVVYAPKKWLKNGENPDIYLDNWILL